MFFIRHKVRAYCTVIDAINIQDKLIHERYFVPEKLDEIDCRSIELAKHVP